MGHIPRADVQLFVLEETSALKQQMILEVTH